ncbi:hypothetical protein ACFZA2_02935 [Microbacterium sp. NPDC007973]
MAGWLSLWKPPGSRSWAARWLSLSKPLGAKTEARLLHGLV